MSEEVYNLSPGVPNRATNINIVFINYTTKVKFAKKLYSPKQGKLIVSKSWIVYSCFETKMPQYMHESHAVFSYFGTC